MMIDEKFVAAIVELAQNSMQVHQVDKAAPVIWRGQLLDLRHLASQPERIRQKTTFYDVASFVSYFQQFGEHTGRIFGDTKNKTMTAILDYHSADQPSWATHSAHFTPVLSTAWRTWDGMNNKTMGQREFAEFFEENIKDIASPPGAELLEMITRLEGTKNVKFLGGVRLENGATQLQYEEEVTGTVGKHKMTVPGSFVLGIPPFEHGQPYRIEALLRWRIKDAAVQFFYKIPRPADYVDAAFRELVTLAQAETGVPVLLGAVG